MAEQMWGGRFAKSTDEMINEFQASINFDKRMYHEDIAGSIAHATMLCKVGILTEEDKNNIISGLKNILAKIEQDDFNFSVDLEDIHMNIEKRLTEAIGEAGGRLHTARSRNDQVALDTHMYVRRETVEVINLIKELQTALTETATKYKDVIMPGYTHLQRAQPILFSHHMMAYFSMLSRDFSRFKGVYERCDIMPLGAGALAGTTFPIDRKFTAKELDFDNIYANSLDAVSDRDFVLEFLSNASILMMHLSRFCEEIILWCSYEFGYIELSDKYSTGSSIMPQKKNPDMAELIRGKSGRVYGHLTALLATMKSLPLAYNKDLQEDKEGVFDAVKTIIPSLKIFAGMLDTLTVNKDKMLHATEHDFSNATELADYLATKGIPFRKAHAIVGQLVFEGIENNTTLSDIPLEKYKEINSEIGEDIYQFLQSKVAVQRRHSLGGTGFDQVKLQIKNAKKRLNL